MHRAEETMGWNIQRLAWAAWCRLAGSVLLSLLISGRIFITLMWKDAQVIWVTRRSCYMADILLGRNCPGWIFNRTRLLQFCGRLFTCCASLMTSMHQLSGITRGSANLCLYTSQWINNLGLYRFVGDWLPH